MQKQFNSPKDINNLNKDNKALWELLAKLSMKNYDKMQIFSWWHILKIYNLDRKESSELIHLNFGQCSWVKRL
jgi:hypothetical protein